MAETREPGDDGPTLGMPSFSLRGRRRPTPPEAVAVDAPTASAASTTQSTPEPEDVAEVAPTEHPRRGTTLAGPPAAAATGVAVGTLGVLLVWLAGVGCEAVRGTSSCGGGPGLLVLVVVLGALAWAGSLMLRALAVPDAGSTSLLAVGILAVLVMVFLLGSLDQWWAALVVQALAAGSYAAAWWVTTSVVGED